MMAQNYICRCENILTVRFLPFVAQFDYSINTNLIRNYIGTKFYDKRTIQWLTYSPKQVLTILTKDTNWSV